MWIYGQSIAMTDELDYVPHAALINLRSIADGVARALGANCEVVLHDLRYPAKSLVHIAGNLTDRKPGAPVTNLVTELLREHGSAAPDRFNYATRGPDGRLLRSSTIFVRHSDRIVGALCINVDVTPLQRLEAYAESLLGFEEGDGSVEQFRNTVEGVLEDLLTEVLSANGLDVRTLTPSQRLRVVAGLDSRGAFLIKGAVDEVARQLGISRYTVYGYLKQVKGMKALASNGDTPDGQSRQGPAHETDAVETSL